MLREIATETARRTWLRLFLIGKGVAIFGSLRPTRSGEFKPLVQGQESVQSMQRRRVSGPLFCAGHPLCPALSRPTVAWCF